MKLSNLFFLVIILSSIVVAQNNLEDVVYLKNGDIIRGTIVENVPGDYIKILVGNSSTITVEYSTILKFTKEKSDLSNTQNYENKNITENDISFMFGGRVGYFSPSEEAVSEIYGGGVSFGLELIMIRDSRFGGIFAIDYFGKSGEPILLDPNNIISDASAEYSVLPITLTGIYKIETSSNVSPYIGLGGGVYFYSEEIKLTAIDGSTANNSTSENVFGFQAEIGTIIETSKSTSSQIGLKYSSASIDGSGAGGSEVDLGGIFIFVGILF
ncbi:MAG: hypothetical protein SCALA702_01720 [Melioribacteraceae bacterium]|nr:MAG: hypothetical protein SCALA702_01720 [Melioribacteraceae bacterium]